MNRVPGSIRFSASRWWKRRCGTPGPMSELTVLKTLSLSSGLRKEVMPRLYEQGVRPQVVVLDPPRKGCEMALLDAVVSMQPERVVYVSCNPATLARNLKYLDGRGYKAVEVQQVDMFPHTAHVECLVLMSRVKD